MIYDPSESATSLSVNVVQYLRMSALVTVPVLLYALSGHRFSTSSPLCRPTGSVSSLDIFLPCYWFKLVFEIWKCFPGSNIDLGHQMTALLFLKITLKWVNGSSLKGLKISWLIFFLLFFSSWTLIGLVSSQKAPICYHALYCVM